MATLTSNLPQPINIPQADTIRSSLGFEGADRSIIGQLFSPGQIAREDWLRDLQKMEYTNQFNASEAEKKRQWDEYMSKTSYQRAVEGMKSAGINPIMGLGLANHASTPTGAVASGSTSSSRGYTSQDSGLLSFLGVIGNIILGAYTNGANNAVKQSIANANNANKLAVANVTRKSESYNQNWNYYSSKRKK